MVKSCELTKLRQLAKGPELIQLAEGFRQVEPAKSCELVKSGKLTKPRQLAKGLELIQLAEGFRQAEPAKSCELIELLVKRLEPVQLTESCEPTKPEMVQPAEVSRLLNKTVTRELMKPTQLAAGQELIRLTKPRQRMGPRRASLRVKRRPRRGRSPKIQGHQ